MLFNTISIIYMPWYTFSSMFLCLFGVFIPFENFLLIRKRQHCRWRTINTCLHDLGLSRLRFKHPTFHLQSDIRYPFYNFYKILNHEFSIKILYHRKYMKKKKFRNDNTRQWATDFFFKDIDILRFQDVFFFSISGLDTNFVTLLLQFARRTTCRSCCQLIDVHEQCFLKIKKNI